MRPEFLSELAVRKLDKKTWVLNDPLVYRSSILDRTVTVPAGFVTDFSSVPRLPFLYWLFGDTAHEAASVHDFLYQTHHCKNRKEADMVFFEAMGAIGIEDWRRWDMYLGVRVGGLGSWLSGRRRFKNLNS